jgi:hypothetical protein
VSRSVWKYEIVIGGTHFHDMPKGARILHVGHPSPLAIVVTFWAEVDPAAEIESREFLVFGTGHPIPDGYGYVGTDDSAGDLIWHLYERVDR